MSAARFCSRLTYFVCAAGVFAFSGCASKEIYPDFQALRAAPDARVAVLPFDNQSTDISAADYMRKLTLERFVKWGYAPLSAEETDEKLKTVGITDGGQLAGVAPAQVGALLGVDLLCYGDVEDFTFQNLGFVVRKSVGLNLKIISAAAGAGVFEASGKGKDIKFYLDKDDARKAFMEAAAVKLAQNMLKLPLSREAETAVSRLFDKMPRR